MSADPSGRPPRPDRGVVRPTTPAVPVLAACVGLLGGWSLRSLALYADATVPQVGWGQVAVVVFVAGVIGGTAWATWRELQVRGTWLEPHRAVNRLVMAKACILVGALLAGGYAGSAISWWGIDAHGAAGHLVRAGCAAVAALAMLASAIWLERACRVRDDDEADLA